MLMYIDSTMRIPNTLPMSFLPTLFPYGREGHIPLPGKMGNLSLEVWARWTLSHHSRRSVVTYIMLYPMHYVMIIKTALLNTQPLCAYYITWSSVERLHLAIRYLWNVKITKLCRISYLPSHRGTARSLGRKLASISLPKGSSQEAAYTPCYCGYLSN